MAQLSFSCCVSSLILLSRVCCSGLETLTFDRLSEREENSVCHWVNELLS